MKKETKSKRAKNPVKDYAQARHLDGTQRCERCRKTAAVSLKLDGRRTFLCSDCYTNQTKTK